MASKLTPAFTRRSLMLGLGTLGLAGCVLKSARSGDLFPSPTAQVDDLVTSGRVPAAGLVVKHGQATLFSHAAGHAALPEDSGTRPRPFLTGTPMRVASVSKLAVALTAHAVAREGGVNLDADISHWFEGGFRHTEYPESPISLAHLLAHTSSMQDPDVYWIASPSRIEQLFTPAMWSNETRFAPGSYFRYCNFAYGIIATVLERATGERFDKLTARHVFGPLDLDAGFNWASVSPAKRARGATLYTRVADKWTAQKDTEEELSATGPLLLLDDGYDLSKYEIGSNGTLFSPQGGLRASLDDLAVLVRAAANTPRLARPSWRYNPDQPNGDTDHGYFHAYSDGAQIHDANDSPVRGIALVGHHGEAYGLYSGAWHVPAYDIQFAYAVTGSNESGPMPSDLHPAANALTAPLFAAASTVIAARLGQ